jgi:LmbE family N-acetylglucosaminyl deacetylase
MNASLRGSVASSLRSAGRRWSSERPPALDPQTPAIVFAPHPDDEVLGCGGTIALKVLAGAPVQVVIMTDGRTSHTPFIDADTLVRMRRNEALAASRVLGLQPSDYHFLDYEDSRLRESARPAARRVAQILDRFQPQEVLVPHRRDRIADHVATFDIVAAAVRAYGKPVTLLEYPVWLWNTWPWSNARPSLRQLLRAPSLVREIVHIAFGCNARIDIRSVRQRKLDALAQYRSQMNRPADSPNWPILADVSDGSFLACFEAYEEVFRRTEANAMGSGAT